MDMPQCTSNSASNNASMPSMPSITVIDDVLLTPTFDAVMGAECQVNLGHIGASPTAMFDTPASEPAFELGDEYLNDLYERLQSVEPAVNHNEVEAPGSVSSFHAGNETEAGVTNPDALQFIEALVSENAALEAPGSVSDGHVATEAEAVVTNPEENRNVGEGEDSVNSPTVLVRDLATVPGDDAGDSGDEFQEPPRKLNRVKSTLSLASAKGKAKAEVSQVAVGSSGKRARARKVAERDPNTGNGRCPILRTMLNRPPLFLPETGNISGPKNKMGRSKQVKSGLSRPVRPAGNISPSPGCSGAVLPAPKNVARPLVIDLVDDSDEEPEVFSQSAENVLSDYRSLCARVRGEHAENLKKVQRSEENFRLADEAFRRAEEARRVAFDTLQGHRRSLDKSEKQLRRIDRR